MKKGRLSEAEKTEIIKMHNQDMSPLEIGEAIDRKHETVSKFIEEVSEVVEENKKGTNFFINKTAAQNNKGVSIMTDAQSSYGDMKKKKRNQGVNPKFKDTIHTIYQDDEE